MKLLIIIVIYEAIIKECVAFKSLCGSISYKGCFSKILLYDNSKTMSEVDFSGNTNIEKYIWDASNGGVSKAYNYAAKYAKEHGFDWLLIADQDTFFPNNIILFYKEAVHNNPDIKLFIPKVRISENGRFLSPVKNRFFFTRISNIVSSGIINPAKFGIINSGILINVDSFLNVGGYNEKVWLDYSDFQFIERFSYKYNKAYVVNCECIQSFSDDIPDVNQKIRRFKLFCSSVKFYQPVRAINKLWIGISVLKRTISLTLQSRSLKPMVIFLNDYLR